MRIIAAAVLAAVTTVGLVVAPAFAKGPTAATLEGPGIDGQHLVLPEGDYAELGELTEATGFWNVFSDRELTTEPPVPESELGPRYIVRWQAGTWMTTYAYPFASTPALHLPRSKAAHGRVVGGWTTGTAAMRTLFEEYGADPATAVPPIAGSGSRDSTTEDAATSGLAADEGTKVGGSSTGRPHWTAYGVVGILAVLSLGVGALRRRARAPQAALRR